MSQLDSVLTSVFTEGGKNAIVYYMTEKYSLTLEQACENPGRLEAALTNLLGESGWGVVKRKIVEHVDGGAHAGAPGSGTSSPISSAFRVMRDAIAVLRPALYSF